MFIIACVCVLYVLRSSFVIICVLISTTVPLDVVTDCGAIGPRPTASAAGAAMCSRCGCGCCGRDETDNEDDDDVDDDVDEDV